MIICDIDNVLANDAWRLDLIKWDEPDLMLRYHQYHSMCLHDPVHHRELLVPQGEDDWPVVLLTAQPRTYRYLRYHWLWQHRLPHNLVVFRPDDDHSHSVDLKRAMLLDVQRALSGKLKDVVTAAYDDREDVVDMYRSVFGLPAECVAINKYAWQHSLTDPKDVIGVEVYQ